MDEFTAILAEVAEAVPEDNREEFLRRALSGFRRYCEATIAEMVSKAPDVFVLQIEYRQELALLRAQGGNPRAEERLRNKYIRKGLPI